MSVSDTTPAPKTPQRRTAARILLEFLGSMNLAILLLVVVAVASVIGTVLQQNQPYADYVRKFGPFWFEVFARLGLYDVYGALWFIAILAFLVMSTAVCLSRQTPHLVREMSRWRTRVRLESLRGFHHHAEWRLAGLTPDAVRTVVTELLKSHGYRWQMQDFGDHQTLAARRGRHHVLGYLLTHAAVVMIGTGGLLDGNLWLKWQEWRGQIAIETRDVTAREVPPISRLAPGTLPAFRGNIMLPEGSAANFVFLRLRDGFLVQELPFAIELKEFQVAYHTTGQPKSFLSQVLIHDKDHLGDQPLQASIQVNHPLTYRGYAIYQSDFGDGGSQLTLKAWPLTGSTAPPTDLNGQVGHVLTLTHGASTALRLELDDFRLLNLLPEPESRPGARKFRNFGPSVSFKLRTATGEAREYLNYMAPVQLDNRWFLISGMRPQVGADMKFVHIPADPQVSPERFLRFNTLLHNTPAVEALLAQDHSVAAAEEPNPPSFQRDLHQVRTNLLALFLEGGFTGITERARTVVPADRLQEATRLYLEILRDTLAKVFIEVLRQEGVDLAKGVSASDETFFDDALTALAALPHYGSPFYLQMTGFKQVEASGLQVTRSSMTGLVYTGFAGLILGVFILFYTAQRRLWVWLSADADGAYLLIAGLAQRRQAEFAREFAQLHDALEQRWGTMSAAVKS